MGAFTILYVRFYQEWASKIIPQYSNIIIKNYLKEIWFSPKHMGMKIFSKVAGKNNYSKHVVFFWLICFFMKNKIFCNVCIKRVNETDFSLMVRTHYIPNSASFITLAILYLSWNIFCSNVHTSYCCVPLIKIKKYNTQQENHLHIVRDQYSHWIQIMQLAKKIIKWFKRLPIGTTPYLDVYKRCRNYNFYWYDFALNLSFSDSFPSVLDRCNDQCYCVHRK